MPLANVTIYVQAAWVQAFIDDYDLNWSFHFGRLSCIIQTNWSFGFGDSSIINDQNWIFGQITAFGALVAALMYYRHRRCDRCRHSVPAVPAASDTANILAFQQSKKSDITDSASESSILQESTRSSTELVPMPVPMSATSAAASTVPVSTLQLLPTQTELKKRVEEDIANLTPPSLQANPKYGFAWNGNHKIHVCNSAGGTMCGCMCTRPSWSFCECLSYENLHKFRHDLMLCVRDGCNDEFVSKLYV